jgi:outer membrane immunogenic protein
MRQMVMAAAAALVFAATPAMAADTNAVTYDPTISPSDWTGFYAGAWIGGRAGTVTATSCAGGPIGVNCASNFGLNGLVGGLTAGYDYQLENDVVVGTFLTLPLVRPTANVTTPLFAPFGMSWDVTPQFALVAGGRLGMAHDRFLPYVLGGLGLATVSVSSNPPPSTTSTATHIGVVLGGGLETKLTDNISVDARYMLGFLGSAQYAFCAFPGCESSYSEVSHNVTVGVNYRF